MSEVINLERQLSRVEASAAGAREGVFGPQSLTWRIDREAALFLGAGRALLLQLAHPWVATAIKQHSRTLADPIGRFHRTFDVMFSLVFGSLDEALVASRRLHLRHTAIAGELPQRAGVFAARSRYLANDVAAMLWVHATLVETALVAHDLVLPPLPADERERYYAESKVLAAMFGLPQEALPADWAAFEVYMRQMESSANLAVTPQAREIAKVLLIDGARVWLRPPRWYVTLTQRLLPEMISSDFGLSMNEADVRRCERMLQRIRSVYPGLPNKLRYVGPYHEACERLAGRARPSISTRMSNLIWIGRAGISRNMSARGPSA